MIRLRDIEIPVQSTSQEVLLPGAVAATLGIPLEELKAMTILKRSLDARRKSKIVFHYQIDVDVADEDSVLARCGTVAERSPGVKTADPLDGLDLKAKRFRHKPVIIGTGPAGTYAALTLAAAGQPCVLIERGRSVEGRMRSINKLRLRGELDPESNYCFGEGGAGTFSDGKLTCGKNHPLIRHVFEEFVRHGAPREILFDAKPHIGTDYLMRIAINMRKGLEQHGSSYMFGRRFVDFREGGSTARWIVVLDDGTEIPTDHLVVAIGHSARETYEMLLDRGLAMVPKPFAVGARIEHPQDQINRIQFGACQLLPAAEYKLASQVGDRGIWTFCMCPGGHLLPTSAQPGKLAINGMSYHARKSGFANAAVVVNVLREDFWKGHVLDGVRFQEKIERDAFVAGGSNYHSPAQRLIDFVAGRETKTRIESTYKPGITNARLDKMLPSFVVDALKGAVGEYNKLMRGWMSEEASVIGVESKTSAPISMVRGKDLQSVSHLGIFPAGEGAGFAGGIVSAALDGVRIGRAVLDSAMSETQSSSTARIQTLH
jgi:uncharacterized FAD-dependent dehydrogenase